MARYIDADLLIEELRELQNLSSPSMSKVANEAIDLGLSLAMRTVRKAPTADVVEVVRCKNCRHLERDDGLKSGKMCLIRGCSGWCDDNDFCSYGEPKTEDNHAHWEYWSGWAGNHDQRIEDATCSNCGYKHPTVRLDYVDGKFIKGYVPDKLAKECPNCRAKMDE
jgi:predicted Zn-ribbon and HTH transcriptional regulator